MANATDTADDIKDPSSYLDETDGKMMVDLTEVYDKTGNKEVDILVDGLEAFALGKLPSQVNKLLGAPYEPGATRYNARMGAEGFLTAIKDGFLKMIKSIIDFLKMVGNWIVRGFKLIFGFEKSERQQKEYKALRIGLKDEIGEILRKLGLPNDLYDIENLMNSVPEASSRVETLTFIKNKVLSEDESIRRLTECVPLINSLANDLSKTTREVNQGRKAIQGKIANLRRKLKANAVSLGDLRELETALLESRSRASFGKITGSLSTLIEKMYDVKTTVADNRINFELLAKDLKDKVGVVNKKIQAHEAKQFQIKIAELESAILSDDTLSLLYIVDKDLHDGLLMLSLDDAQIVGTCCDIVQDQSAANCYVAYCNEIKLFSREINEIIKIVRDIKLNADNLLKWRNRVEVVLQAYLTEDLDTIRKCMIEMRARGEIDPSVMARDGKPMKYVLNDAINPQTLAEKVATFNKEALDADIAGVKKKVDNFKSQLGL